MPATYKITWSQNGQEGSVSFECDENRCLLDEAESLGFDWPSSSRAGADETSAARLVSGKVDQSNQSYLSEEQVAAGYILYDVAYPRSDCVLVIGVEDELFEKC
jgi:ferredoxin